MAAVLEELTVFTSLSAAPDCAPHLRACAKTWTGLWTMDCGLWTVDYGLWTVDCGLWTVDCVLVLSEPGRQKLTV